MLSVGWAVASYSHALRQAYNHKYTLSWPGLMIQTLWHMSLAAARVMCLVAFAAIFKAWIFLVIGKWGKKTEILMFVCYCVFFSYDFSL